MGNELHYAVEEGGSTIARWFLKSLRPFEIMVRTLDNLDVLRVARPFRFYFHELEVFDANNIHIGTIERQFSLLRRIYTVFDSLGQESYQLYGPILHPWTFEIRKGDNEIGKITKKWSGVLKEGFTDADNFGITFPVDADSKAKTLLLGAVFLIDFVHFEKK